nr:hypothetical protein [Streptomyces sp. Ru73]
METLRSAPGRWTAALLLGGLWWWAVLRLLFWPEGAGVVEGAMVAGGWGLSLLPVHCVPRQARRGGGRAGVIGWRRRGGCAGRPYGPALPDRITDGFTKAYTKAHTKARRYRRDGPGRL